MKLIMKLKFIIFTLLTCFIHVNHTISKVRTAVSFSANAIKSTASAVKAHPYVSLAALSAAAATRYVHYRYHFHANQAKNMKLSGPQPLDIGKLPDELMIHIPDNSIEQLNLADDELYTSCTFEELIRQQAKRRDCLIIARVAQAGNNKSYYYEADSFNQDFFRHFGPHFVGSLAQHRWGEGVQVGYPIDIERIGDTLADYTSFYQIRNNRQNIDTEVGVQYFIYDYRKPDKGFEYLCTYGNELGDFCFYNNFRKSSYYHKTQNELLEIIYTNQTFSMPAHTQIRGTLQKNLKLAGKKRIYGAQSIEAQVAEEVLQESRLEAAQAAAKRASAMTFQNFIRNHAFRPYNRYAIAREPEPVIIMHGIIPLYCLLLAGLSPVTTTIGYSYYKLIGLPFVMPKINLYNLMLNDYLREKEVLSNWPEAVAYMKGHLKFLLKGAGISASIGAIIFTGITINAWLKARDAEAARAAA